MFSLLMKTEAISVKHVSEQEMLREGSRNSGTWTIEKVSGVERVTCGSCCFRTEASCGRGEDNQAFFLLTVYSSSTPLSLPGVVLVSSLKLPQWPQRDRGP